MASGKLLCNTGSPTSQPVFCDKLGWGRGWRDRGSRGRWCIYTYIAVIQWLSHVWLFAAPWTSGSSVLHCLPEFIQIHVHRVGDAIQPSHPLSSPSPPAFSLCQHQGLFQWVGSSHQVAKVLAFQLQQQSVYSVYIFIIFLLSTLHWHCFINLKSTLWSREISLGCLWVTDILFQLVIYALIFLSVFPM